MYTGLVKQAARSRMSRCEMRNLRGPRCLGKLDVGTETATTAMLPLWTLGQPKETRTIFRPVLRTLTATEKAGPPLWQGTPLVESLSGSATSTGKRCLQRLLRGVRECASRRNRSAARRSTATQARTPMRKALAALVSGHSMHTRGSGRHRATLRISA